MVVGPVLTAALALVALPGLAGSRVPSPIEPVPAGAFQPLPVPANVPRSTISIAGLDRDHRSAGVVGPDAALIEPADVPAIGPIGRPTVVQPRTRAIPDRRPPRFVLRGEATFYDNGTTAMRLPRGTLVVICGNGGCIERTVSDYGPVKPSRIVDLYRPDFFAICGCQWFAGITDVTVYVY
jgi:hypothetical protein